MEPDQLPVALFILAIVILHVVAPFAACITAGFLFFTFRKYWALNPCCPGSGPRRMQLIGMMIKLLIVFLLLLAEIFLTR